ncbi:MAG TPA: hypothetical protein DCQ36_08025 [Actinobacteria bacterium]|jgi:DNA-binding CsgD family transcriptional regulator/RimJ/RimL family protein N-acetyltransferase|nr:hypothetical protein [Actinomycetota bacterium]
MAPAGERPTPILSDGIVTLRPLDARDIPDITAAGQDPQVIESSDLPTPFTPEDATDLVSGGEVAPDHAAPVTWALTVLPDDRWSGSVSLLPDGCAGARVGSLLAPWARGSGHLPRALRLACAWGFSTLGLEVVTWSAYAGDDLAMNAARQVGFRIPRHVFGSFGVQRGRRRDCWIGTLTPDDLRTAARLAEARRDYLGPELTRREVDVLRQLARGLANRAVAAELGISENTVKNHVRSILEKLQASSRSEAVVRALNLGIVSLPADQPR